MMIFIQIIESPARNAMGASDGLLGEAFVTELSKFACQMKDLELMESYCCTHMDSEVTLFVEDTAVCTGYAFGRCDSQLL